MKPIESFLSHMIHPDKEFTPIPFWFFNDKPDRGKIKKQLTDYVEKGIYGIVLHPRIGIPKELPYLSDEYFKVIRFIVRTAKRLEMKIVLYDEGMYPSGSAHGLVVKANPDFASRGIKLVKEPGEKEVIVKLPEKGYVVSDFTGGTIRGIHFGEDDKEAGAPLSADILNPKAVKQFIHLTHDRYYKELKEYFGTTIIGFFTDEPCILGRNVENSYPWKLGLDKDILEKGGVLEELQGLFDGVENRTTEIYHKLIKKCLRETFYSPLEQWCEKHGIWLMGHPAESDDVEEEFSFHVPGQDLIMRRVSPETGGLLEPDSVQAKITADIARHLGRRRNANECFGVCCRNQIPWYFTGKDMKWYIDWLGIRGVNLYIPHAFYYSVEGERKGERPPDVGPHNIWWEDYKKFSDYMKRLSFLMTDSKNGAKVAVLCDNNRIPYKEVAYLYENQIEFNYLPIALLEECQRREGKLVIKGYEYDEILNVLADSLEPQVWEQKLAGIRIVRNEREIRNRTIETEALCKGLRVSHLTKDSLDMYLLSNEGSETIDTVVAVPGIGDPLFVDLWTGKYGLIPCERKDETTKFQLVLRECETLLVVMGEKESIRKNWEQEVSLGDWTERFQFVERKRNRAVYQYCFLAASLCGRKVFEIRGEEMAECYCNGQKIDTSFWSPHCFRIGEYLHTGENLITIVMTGNAANLYSGESLFYGLK